MCALLIKQTVMKGMGNAIMGSGTAEGENRHIKAANDALNNPILGSNNSIRVIYFFMKTTAYLKRNSYVLIYIG